MRRKRFTTELAPNYAVQLSAFQPRETAEFQVKNGKPVIARIMRALWVPLAGLLAATAWADDASSRWSLGMQLGQARGAGDSDQWTGDPALSLSDPAPMSYDVSATVGGKDRFGWRVFTGYRLTNYFAIHLGYADLGVAQSRRVDTGRALDRSLSFDRSAVQSVRGVDVGLQLKVPVTDRVWVELRGGRYYWDSRTRTSTSWTEGYPAAYRDAVSFTRRGSDNLLGAGLEIDVVADLSATLGWTRYEVAGESVALWTVGALYRFGFY